MTTVDPGGADAAPAHLPVDPWDALRATTRARIGLGRAGDALTTSVLLELQAAHAAARDAVHVDLDFDGLRAQLGERSVTVHSAAPDRATYLQRPDLGRRLSPASRRELEAVAGTGPPPDLVVVLADGLSATAVEAHAVPVLLELERRLEGWLVAPAVVALQARVALGDEVGALLGAHAVIVLVGERPGLSAPDSLGAYLTWDPRPGRHDGERNCVSNMRPPHGQPIDEAAVTLVRLLQGARKLGASGVALKDIAPAVLPEQLDTGAG